jgi:3-deoxy-D-manno-octulosonic-acid transferase
LGLVELRVSVSGGISVFLVWDVLYFCGLIVGFPVLVYRMMTRRRYRSGFWERLGGAPRRAGEKRCLWVHGVSVGEVLGSATLVEGFRRRHPDWDVVISSTTSTGYETAKRTFPDCMVIYYPLDFTGSIARSLSRIRPSLVILMELEVWPNFVRLAGRRGIPVVIANGRLSKRSYGTQRMFRFVLSGVYERIARLAVQTEEYARRFRGVGVGAEKITVTGSLKYDTVARSVRGAEALSRELGIASDARLLVAGSTTAGEEEVLLQVYGRLATEFPKLRLVIVPRRPERFDGVASLIRSHNFACLRRSAGGKGDRETDDAVILGDTLGELVRFYALATVVFVGKSMEAPGGGQNIMEPAALGKPVVFGLHMANFQETRDLLRSKDAGVEVGDAEGLYQGVRRLLGDEKAATEMGERARAAIDGARGATDRTLDVVEEALAFGGKPV